MSASLSERFRDSLPDVESVLIAVLCLGVLLVFLDLLGVDVIENLRGNGGLGDLWYLLYPAAMALLSYLVERLRDAFDEPHTADVPDPLGDHGSESESGTEDNETEDEPATKERTVELVRSQNDPTE